MLEYNLTFCGDSFLEIPVTAAVDYDGTITGFEYENGRAVRNPRLVHAMEEQLQEEVWEELVRAGLAQWS